MENRGAIPDDVRKELRAEVGYGCPICRSPFLTWHHFDPPYSIRPHHEPEGMIALCREHHDEADNDNWPPDELRKLKKTRRLAEDVKGSFPSWEHENMLVRLGGNYTGGSEVLVAIGGQNLVRLRRNAAGLLALSFDLWDMNGTPLLKVADNALELHPRGVHDFVVTAKKREVKLWLRERDIGLDLVFERITVEELEKLLGADFERSKKKTDERLKKEMEKMDKWQREHLQEALSRPASVPWWIDKVSPEIREQVRQGFLTGDGTGTRVKKWALENCVETDGKIPFFNFKDLSFFFLGRRLRVRDGLAFEGLQIGYSSFFDNALGAINLALPG